MFDKYIHLMIYHQSNTIVFVYTYPSKLCLKYFCKLVTMKSWTDILDVSFETHRKSAIVSCIFRLHLYTLKDIHTYSRKAVLYLT
jgi:hypothetical protein